MVRGRRTWAVAGWSIVAGCLLTPGAAYASTITWADARSDHSTGSIWFTGATVVDSYETHELKESLAPEANEVTLRWNGERLLFADTVPITPALDLTPLATNEAVERCRFSGFAASCEPPRGHPLSGGLGVVGFGLHGGDDSLRVDDSVRERVTVDGGEGADHLRSSGQVFGGPGDDTLVAAAHRSALGFIMYNEVEGVAGDPGDDRFRARNGVADKIYCGPGGDIVWADPIDELSDDCETVRIG